MSLLARLRHRTIHSPTSVARAYWLRALLRNKARLGRWDHRMLNGHAGDVTPQVRREIMRGVAAGLIVTSTTGGKHAATSYHKYEPGRAVDLGHRRPGTTAARVALVRHQRACALHPERYVELFGPSSRDCVKNHQHIALTEESGLENQHDNHLHVAC